MPGITIAQICDAIESTLSAATGINTTQSYDELGEGLNAADLPLLQVYWETLIVDPSAETDRATFQAGMREKLFTFNVNVYAAPLAHLAQNMESLVDITDDVLAVLELQNTKPYFGLDGIKAWHLNEARRVVFEYTASVSPVRYVGPQFVLAIWVY